MLTLSQTFHRRLNASHLGHIFTIHRTIYMFPQKKNRNKTWKKNIKFVQKIMISQTRCCTVSAP